jgi:hypothetical protein
VKWFRFYHDALDDPKVQLLTDHRYRQWVNLLCLASLSIPRGSLPDLAGIAFRLRLSVEEAREMLDEFVCFTLLDVDGEGHLQPHNWNGRQHASDDVTARVAKHRERLNAINGRNVTETLQKRASRARADTDTDTDTEREPPRAPAHTRARESGGSLDSHPIRMREKHRAMGLQISSDPE